MEGGVRLVAEVVSMVDRFLRTEASLEDGG